MSTTIEKFEHAGLTILVGYEEDSTFANPRQYDNLGRMVCWHPDYALGDEQITNPDGRGAVEHRFEEDDFESMEDLYRRLGEDLGAVVALPLYLYEHSGISMHVGAPCVFDTPSGGEDHHGNRRGFDTSAVGYVYTTRERIRELCGDPQIESDPFYCPRTWPEDGRSGHNWTGTAEEWIAQQLAQEVDLYDQYLRGEVYWYRIEDEEGDVLDSCGGFLGGGVDESGAEIDGLDYCKQEAREAAESCREAIEETRRRFAPYSFADVEGLA